MKKAGEENYEVGYGKPPKHSQFQKGSSGNPKGRPKKERNLDSYILQEFNAPIFINENGVRRRVPKSQALVKRSINKALAGDQAVFRIVLKLYQEALTRSTSLTEPQQSELNNSARFLSDDEIMLRLCESLAKSPGAKIPENLAMIGKFYKDLLE